MDQGGRLLKMGSIGFMQNDKVLDILIYLHTGYSGTGIWFTDLDYWVLTGDGWNEYRDALSRGKLKLFAGKLKRCLYEQQTRKLNF